MFEGLYNSASGMVTQSKIQEVIANNIAKATVHGYKRQAAISTPFENELKDQMGASDEISNQTGGVDLEGVYTVFDQGRIKNTGNTLDLAIEGDGFFVVDLNGKEYYTRNGSFSVNNEGDLITSNGELVMGEGGKINVLDKNDLNPAFTRKISVSIDGIVSIMKSDGKENKEVGRLKIVSFKDLSEVKPVGQCLFTANSKKAEASEKFKISQGFLEESNVNILDEMVSMIANMRIYEANQRILRGMNDSLGKGIAEISRI